MQHKFVSKAECLLSIYQCAYGIELGVRSKLIREKYVCTLKMWHNTLNACPNVMLQWVSNENICRFDNKFEGKILCWENFTFQVRSWTSLLLFSWWKIKETAQTAKPQPETITYTHTTHYLALSLSLSQSLSLSLSLSQALFQTIIILSESNKISIIV